MMTHTDTYPEIFIRKTNTANRTVFNTFLDALRCPMLLENGDVIVKASVSYYCRQQLHRDVMIVKLITHGYDAGDIHLISNSKTITPENFELVLRCEDSKYALGRSGTELVVEGRSSKMGGSYRIDLEEKLYGSL